MRNKKKKQGGRHKNKKKPLELETGEKLTKDFVLSGARLAVWVASKGVDAVDGTVQIARSGLKDASTYLNNDSDDESTREDSEEEDSEEKDSEEEDSEEEDLEEEDSEEEDSEEEDSEEKTRKKKTWKKKAWKKKTRKKKLCMCLSVTHTSTNIMHSFPLRSYDEYSQYL